MRPIEPLVRWILVALLAAGLTACADLQLFIANVAVASGAFKETRNVAYGSDPQQQLDIYRPPRASRTASDPPRPVVVFFHGGSWSADSKNEYKFVGVALAEQGWIGVVPNYRQYPQVRFPAFVDDAARAIAWVHDNVARYGGDPARVVLMGHSSGAHIAMLAALDKRYLAANGIDANGIRGVIGLSGAYDFLPLEAGHVQQVFEGVADPLDTQPVHFVRADAPPILLLHGSSDTMVAASNSTSLAAALSRVGARVQLKIYEGRSHSDLAAAFSRLSRDPPPVLADVGSFVARVTALH